MASKSIGSLFVDIEARTAKLEQDMGKVKTILDNGTASVNKQGEAFLNMSKNTERNLTQLTQRVAGALTLFTFMKKEIIDVAKHIGDIPGVSQEVISSIHTMNYSLEKSKEQLGKFVAEYIVSPFANFGQGIGLGIGAMIYGEDSLTDAFDKLNKEAEAFANKDHVKKLKELNLELSRLQVKPGNRVSMLLEEASALDGQAQSMEKLSERQEAEVHALKKRIEAQRELNVLNNNYTNAFEKWAEVATKEDTVYKSVRQRIEELTRRSDNLHEHIASITNAGYERADNQTDESGFPLAKHTPEEVEKLTKLYEKLTRIDRERFDLLRRQGEMFREIGRTIADNLGDAILQGKNLKTLLQSLAGDILKIILTRTITGPLGDLLGGGLASFFTGKASGGPIQGAHVVGEYGPELFIPNGGGTIVPNDKLRGGSGGNTYLIDAKGVDASVVGRLEQMLLALAGPGVVEQRAISANTNFSRRSRS